MTPFPAGAVKRVARSRRHRDEDGWHRYLLGRVGAGDYCVACELAWSWGLSVLYNNECLTQGGDS